MFFEEKRKVDLSGRSKKQDRSATLLKAQREREERQRVRERQRAAVRLQAAQRARSDLGAARRAARAFREGNCGNSLTLSPLREPEVKSADFYRSDSEKVPRFPRDFRRIRRLSAGLRKTRAPRQIPITAKNRGVV